MLSLHSPVYIPMWAGITLFIINFVSRRKMAQESINSRGIYSEGIRPRRTPSECGVRKAAAPAPRTMGPQRFSTAQSCSEVQGQSSWRGSGLPTYQCILCSKKPSVRRGGRGSRAEAGPGALTGRSPGCQRCRWLPWQIPGACRWSEEGGEQG